MSERYDAFLTRCVSTDLEVDLRVMTPATYDASGKKPDSTLRNTVCVGEIRPEARFKKRKFDPKMSPRATRAA